MRETGGAHSPGMPEKEECTSKAMTSTMTTFWCPPGKVDLDSEQCLGTRRPGATLGSGWT